MDLLIRNKGNIKGIIRCFQIFEKMVIKLEVKLEKDC